ncbi:hypothetical protein FRX54_06205, partial [Streptococcus sp. sy004]
YFHNPHLVRLIQFSKVLTSPLRRQLLHSIKLYIPCQLLCQKKIKVFDKVVKNDFLFENRFFNVIYFSCSTKVIHQLISSSIRSIWFVR